jgi:elongation factor Ts
LKLKNKQLKLLFVIVTVYKITLESMDISAEQIKKLREKTGAGMLNCKNALMENQGDFEKAVAFLRQKGLASAEKKLTRSTKQGIITSYIHTGSKVGILLELNCETDFVARRTEFQNLAKTLAMQVAASSAVNYVSLKDIPESLWESETRIEGEREDLKSKPENIRQSILKGRVEKTLKTFTLLNQSCIRDPDLTVEDYIKNHVSLLGENIQITRFCKFIVGETETGAE